MRAAPTGRVGISIRTSPENSGGDSHPELPSSPGSVGLVRTLSSCTHPLDLMPHVTCESFPDDRWRYCILLPWRMARAPHHFIRSPRTMTKLIVHRTSLDAP